MFWTTWSTVIFTFPTATPSPSVFLNWNLMIDFPSSTFVTKLSSWVILVGNFNLEQTGPSVRGMILRIVSEAKSRSYCLKNLLISFLFLLNFFKSSIEQEENWFSCASSQWSASPIIQTLRFGLGICFKLIAPLKRLSVTVE
mgnify:CR=1 FL=1